MVQLSYDFGKVVPSGTIQGYFHPHKITFLVKWVKKKGTSMYKLFLLHLFNLLNKL
jgi:hypothetical protein